MKKIIIIILFLVALLFVIFQPFGSDAAFDKYLKDGAGFWGYVEAYYAFSGALLCWVGISAGYKFVEYKDFPGWVSLIAILIGFLLSPIIALVQLFIPKR